MITAFQHTELIARASQRRVTSVISIATVVLLVCAACGSSSKHSTNAQASPTTGKTLTGPPVTIGLMASLVASTANLQDSAKAGQIAVDAINANGGIKGRALKLDVCDDHDNPQDAAICARTLLQQDKVLLVAGSGGRQTGALYPVLDAVHTIGFGTEGTNPLDFSSSNSYPLSGAGLISVAGEAFVYDPTQIHNVTIVHTQNTQGLAFAQVVQKFFQAKGTTAELLGITPGTPNMQPECLKIQQNGSQAVASVIANVDFVTLVNTCQQQGLTDVTYLTGSGSLSADVVQALSHAKSRIALNYAMDPSMPMRSAFLSQVKQYSKSVGGMSDLWSDSTINSWLSVALLGKVLNAVPDLTPTAIQSYLDSQTAFETGLTPPLNFATPAASVPKEPRYFDVSVLAGTAQNGQVVDLSSNWIKVFP